MIRKKRIKPNVGDVFTFKLENGLNCFGQIVAPSPDGYRDLLYVLYDFASFEEPPLNEIVKKPILAIANLVGGDIEDGYWTIIENEEIPASLIVLPDYVISGERGPVVLRYDGTFVRTSTIEEQFLAGDNKIPNLRTWTTSTGGFEQIANYRFNGGELNQYFEDMLFEGSMWDARVNPDGMPLRNFLDKPLAASDRHEVMMIKKEQGKPPYFVHVSASDRILHIEEGDVGEKPKYTQFKIFDEFTDQAAVKNVEKQLLSDGFEQFEHDQYHTIIIRYDLAIGGFGTEEDLERRYQIEDLLGEKLRRTNNGDCTGGEIGNGEAIIFCDVIDQDAAVKTIQKTLKRNGFIKNVKISLNEEVNE
ncbi:Imm26 family immunity protein [Paenibacillus prosopidis]|uniref:Immunity protein 26 of polymorphic toxin system n=1 Tax=Paenibacillus prosopidis TaxID=630520 RepID=A0A368VFS9_9BACL|nr:Imm26 family immunity protein [Paenibacillus prosopidis]RCW40089.1 immunity protein 26 of polymorphic toxin system [Paenibacillus prosopidis]